MRYRGAGRGWRTLSRFALIGVIGGGAAACSSDASRLSDPFTNPFASSEPAATGSLPEDGTATRAPAIRTPRIQSQALGAPAAMSARPLPAASRVASTEPVSGEAGGSVAGMNPDAGRLSPRTIAAPKPVATPNPRAVEKAAEKAEAKRLEAKAAAKREAEARAEAAEEAEAKKVADRKLAERKIAERKLADKKTAEAKARHVRPGQTAKAEERADEKHAKTARDTKADEAKAAREAARADAARDAARRVTEARAAEAAAKASAKETAVKEASVKETKAPAKEAPIKVASAEPASAPASDANDSFRWPAKGRVINGYGSAGNEGINIAVPEGTPVKAAEDGTVAYAGSDVKGYGKLVLVRHTNGYVSAYAHNGELDVRPGEKVKRGQTIAKSGATGNVTSPQLHFEIRKGATPVDPMPHLASN